MNLVFDFGAVLFTWKPADILAAAFPEQAGEPRAADSLARAVFGHPDWHNFDRGTLAPDDVVARTAERLALDATVLAELVAQIGERLQPMADTVALLAQLHSQRAQRPALRLYYLSNMPEPYARVLEQRHGFLQWFDGGVFSGDVRITKPDPAIYQLLQTRYALAPEQTVFIDDLHANVNAANALGWHGIQFESTQQLRTRLEAIGVCKDIA